MPAEVHWCPDSSDDGQPASSELYGTSQPTVVQSGPEPIAWICTGSATQSTYVMSVLMTSPPLATPKFISTLSFCPLDLTRLRHPAWSSII